MKLNLVWQKQKLEPGLFSLLMRLILSLRRLLAFSGR
jgi:hypothetical protein